MRDAAAFEPRNLAAVVDVVGIGQPGGHVVGRQDRHFGGGGQAVGPHHADIHPADRQHGCIAQRRGRHSADCGR